MSDLDLPSVSVVIPTKGRIEFVERSLRELIADPATTEIVVVIVRGVGGTACARWQALDDRVRTIEADEGASDVMERGAFARDQGVLSATGEVILALDDDVVPRPGLVSGHARRHASDPCLLVLGYMPVSRPKPGGLTGTARVYSASYERECARFAADSEAILLGLWGGNYSLRRTHWLASLELPRIPAGYHGDREFGLRLRKLGLRAAFDPVLRADHLYARSLTALVEDARSAGIGHARLLSAYPELRTYPGAAPRVPMRIVKRATRGDAAWRVTSAVLHTLANSASGGKLPALEDMSIRLMWQLSFERGLREATASDNRRPAPAPDR